MDLATFLDCDFQVVKKNTNTGLVTDDFCLDHLPRIWVMTHSARICCRVKATNHDSYMMIWSLNKNSSLARWHIGTLLISAQENADYLSHFTGFTARSRQRISNIWTLLKTRLVIWLGYVHSISACEQNCEPCIVSAWNIGVVIATVEQWKASLVWQRVMFDSTFLGVSFISVLFCLMIFQHASKRRALRIYPR